MGRYFRIPWKVGVPSDIWVDCPHCHKPARTTNATIPARRHDLNLEAICYACDKYVYVTIAMPPAKVLNGSRLLRAPRVLARLGLGADPVT